MDVFSYYEYEQTDDNNAEQPTGQIAGRFHALAIAPDSELDMVLVEGRPLGVGCPLFFNGAVDRALSVRAKRRCKGVAKILAIHEPCGLNVLPGIQHRIPLIFDSEKTHTSVRQVRLVIAGRRHISLGLRGEVNDVFTFNVERFTPTRILTKAILTVTLAATREDWEIGGTNEEECYEILSVDISPTDGNSTTTLRVEAYGELGR